MSCGDSELAEKLATNEGSRTKETNIVGKKEA
jgi:hypothetical protein